MNLNAITTADFAQRFSMDRVTVLARIRDGSLVAVDISRQGSSRPSWRIPIESVDAFVERRSSSITRPISEV